MALLRYLGLVAPCFQQGCDLVSLLLGKRRLSAHWCLRFLQEQKAMLLTQLALFSGFLRCIYEVNPRHYNAPRGG